MGLPAKRTDNLLRPVMPELDSLRGVAVLLVLIFHGFSFPATVSKFSGVAHVFVAATAGGWTGVNLFFVLSGFLITGILFDSKSRPDYYSRFYSPGAQKLARVLFAPGTTPGVAKNRPFRTTPRGVAVRCAEFLLPREYDRILRRSRTVRCSLVSCSRGALLLGLAMDHSQTDAPGRILVCRWNHHRLPGSARLRVPAGLSLQRRVHMVSRRWLGLGLPVRATRA